MDLTFSSTIDSQGKLLFVTDETVWGPPDNANRNEIALMCIVEKVNADSENTILRPMGNQIDYNDSYNNSHHSTFKFYMEDDGVHIVHLLILPNSPIGSNEGEYFYNPLNGNVYRIDLIGGTPTYVLIPPEDYYELIDPVNISKPLQEGMNEFLIPKLSIKESELYNEYRIARRNCDNEDEILNKELELYLNLVHAESIFNRGLLVEAESIIDTQCALFEL
jgi:hypothetical protein